MEKRVLASTKVGYELPREEAILFSGKSAGICYMKATIEELFNEDDEKSLKRAKSTLESGHHSVYGHAEYTFSFEGIPKIIAILLNNEKEYNTSEKSARYTEMAPSKEEEEIYYKWIELLEKIINEVYPEIIKLDSKKPRKLAQENARYMISVFTPATNMEYTTSFRQMNYILHWFDDFIQNAEDNEFNRHLKLWLINFNKLFDSFRSEKLKDNKNRTLSTFAKRNRKEEWGENYCVNYMATFAQFAQTQRHRTLHYEMQVPKVEDAIYFVPPIIIGTTLEEEWLKDIKSLGKMYPQGTLVHVNERGTVEDFIMKTKERLCGQAQLEIAMQTSETMKNYLKNTKDTNIDVYNDLLPYSKGARCTFFDFTCKKPCIFGAKDAFTRKI